MRLRQAASVESLRQEGILAYSILWERRGAYIGYREAVSFGEFLEAVLAIHAHPNYAGKNQHL